MKAMFSAGAESCGGGGAASFSRALSAAKVEKRPARGAAVAPPKRSRSDSAGRDGLAPPCARDAGVGDDGADGGEEGRPGRHRHLADEDVAGLDLARLGEGSDDFGAALGGASGGADALNDAGVAARFAGDAKHLGEGLLHRVAGGRRGLAERRRRYDLRPLIDLSAALGNEVLLVLPGE